MMKFNSKKGDSQMWWIIVGAILAILVAIFIVIWFSGSGNKAFGGVNKNLDSLGDYDSDKVSNFQDKCPCTAALLDSEKGLVGCPRGTTEKQAIEDSKCYSEKGCKDCQGSSNSHGSTSSVVTSPELKLKLFDSAGKPIVSEGFETIGSEISYEFSCKGCILTVERPDGSGTLKEGSFSFALSKKGTYTFALAEGGVEIERYTVLKK